MCCPPSTHTCCRLCCPYMRERMHAYAYMHMHAPPPFYSQLVVCAVPPLCLQHPPLTHPLLLLLLLLLL